MWQSSANKQKRGISWSFEPLVHKRRLPLLCECINERPWKWQKSDAVNKATYDHYVPVSLLLHRSSAASLGLFPFTSASLCSKLPQDSLFELLSSVGDGGKLPSREELHEKDILWVETFAKKKYKSNKTSKIKSATESWVGFRAPPGPTDSLQQWNKALNTQSQFRLRPLHFSANEGLAHVLNVQPCLVTFSAGLMRRSRRCCCHDPGSPSSSPFNRLDEPRQISLDT